MKLLSSQGTDSQSLASYRFFSNVHLDVDPTHSYLQALRGTSPEARKAGRFLQLGTQVPWQCCPLTLGGSWTGLGLGGKEVASGEANP